MSLSASEHEASPFCPCRPVEVEEGVWVHRLSRGDATEDGERRRWERARALGRGLAYLLGLKPSSRA